MNTLAGEFTAFVRARTPSLLRSAYLLTGDQHLAEDLVQNALMRTHRAWNRLERAGNAEAYTRKVMYHLQVAWWRRGKVAESLAGDRPELLRGGPLPGDHATVTAVRLTLQTALLRLTNAFRPTGGDVGPSTSTPPATGSSAPSRTQASPTPQGSTSTAPGPTARHKLSSWTTTDKTSLPGTLYHVTGEGYGTGTIRLNVLTGGKLRTAALQGAVTETDCVHQSIVFSPDGRSVAWVESGDQDMAGNLVVTSLDGGGQRILMGDVQCRGGAGPKWMPDSQRLLVRTGEVVKIVDVASGTATPTTQAWSEYLAWSRNGAFVAYAENGQIVVAAAAGGVVRRVPYDINCCTGGFSIQGISDSGRYVGVSFENSDPSTVRGAMKIVDMTTGREVDLGRTPPASGGIEVLLAGDQRLFSIRTQASTMTVELDGGASKVTLPAAAGLRLYRP